MPKLLDRAGLTHRAAFPFLELIAPDDQEIDIGVLGSFAARLRSEENDRGGLGHRADRANDFFEISSVARKLHRGSLRSPEWARTAIGINHRRPVNEANLHAA